MIEVLLLLTYLLGVVGLGVRGWRVFQELSLCPSHHDSLHFMGEQINRRILPATKYLSFHCIFWEWRKNTQGGYMSSQDCNRQTLARFTYVT